jgi:integrase
MTEAVLVDVKYLYSDPDRHGNDRLYFRRREGKKVRKVRLREKPDTPEFHEEFAAALAGRPYIKAGAKTKAKAPSPPRVTANSLRWLVGEYYRRSLEFKAYDEETQKVRRRILNELCNEPVTIGSPQMIGELPSCMTEDAVIIMRDRKAETSIDSANARVKAIRKLYEWALSVKPVKLVPKNTAKAVDLLRRIDTGGHHTWTIEEILQFIQRHPPGTKAYLALMLFLLFGQRISDISKFGKQHIRKPEHVSDQLRQIHPGRWLAFRQHKNRKKSPVDLVIPILPELEHVLNISPCGAMTFLETVHGKPHTTKGLGNWWADRCIEAKVPGRAHGLRKAGATIAAERGATPHQLMAIFGWKTLAQAELYTKKARQQMIAGGAMNLVSLGQTMNECDPLLIRVQKSGSNEG